MLYRNDDPAGVGPTTQLCGRDNYALPGEDKIPDNYLISLFCAKKQGIDGTDMCVT